MTTSIDDISDGEDEFDAELEGMIFRAVEAFHAETEKPRSDAILAFLHGVKTLLREMDATAIMPIPKETP